MRVTLIAFFILFVFSISFAQVPSIKWQKTFGGGSYEYLGLYDTSRSTHPKVMIPITSGGYLIGCSTSSSDFDIVGGHGGLDIWLSRLDSLGNVIWKNCYGGSGNETLGSVTQIGDEGFILIGTTSSNNGDVLGNHGLVDIWVVRLDMSGNVVWQKCFGGTSEDYGSFIDPTHDGGFILTGKTNSNNGDITGLHGSFDIWVAKLTSSGNLSWQKCFGGTDEDRGFIIRETGSNNYILGTETFSSNGDITGFHGPFGQDIWVALLDNLGTPIWKRALGGSNLEEFGDIEPTKEGGFIIAGGTSSNDGDVSDIHVYGDGWLVKLNSDGSLQWQKCLGGSDGEAFSHVQSLPDGGYIAIGNSYSTDGDISNNMGYYDSWIVKVNNAGVLQWSKCIGGSNIDLGGVIYAFGPNSYIALSTVYSSDKDVTGNHGSSDLWLTYLSWENAIKGTLYVDQNSNGVKDNGEPYFSDAIVTSKSTTDSVSSIPANGLFINNVGVGNYRTAVNLNKPYYTIVPSSITSNFSTVFNVDSISFALQPIVGINDLQVNLLSTSIARPGFNATYTMVYKNSGTLTQSGEVLLKPDSRLTLISSSPSYTNIIGDTLRWTFSNLQPPSPNEIQLVFHIAAPPSANIGDILTSIAIINPVNGDVTPLDDTAVLKQRLRGAVDPNDKIESNGGIIGSDYITQGKYLNYTIRFQNTGTDTAFSVIVRDTLDNKLNWSTFEMVTASHPYTVSITNQNKIEWTFSNINLPDSNINEPLSHGYLSYRVKPKSTAVVGDVINNLASIYFDYNLPVATNNALTLVQDNFSALPIQLLNFTGQLNNNTVQLQWKISDAKNFEKFEIERSLDGRNYGRIQTVAFANSITSYHSQDNISILQSGQIFYRLKLVDADGKFSYSKVIVFNLNTTQSNFIVYPNPVRTELFVSLSTGKKQNLNIKILDASGRTILNQQKEIQKGNNVFPVNISKLTGGSYLLQIIFDGESKASRFTIIN
jgi:uncharacterized repeat protein (TIGR01451 family)